MNEHPDDPVYTSSRREALVALGAWVACGLYTLTYSYLAGYDRSPEELSFTWGVPDWVLFGVFLPWSLANVFAWWFSFRFVRDVDLDPDTPRPFDGASGGPPTTSPSHTPPGRA